MTRSRYFCGLGLGLLAVGLAVHGVGVIRAMAAEETEWRALAVGLWYRPWSLEGVNDGSPASGHAFRVDPKLARLDVLDARREGRKMVSARGLREEAGALLVLNGGFFDEKDRPLGLVVSGGRETSKLRRVDHGVFYLSEGVPGIRHSREPLPDSIDAAIESGPRLVVGGRPVRLKPQVSRRSSVCLPGDGSVILALVDDAVSLADLATHLSKPVSAGGLGCWSALNLDGGQSSQLSLATPEMSLEVAGGWPVPNALAVFAR